jgi:hypothetical protein
MKSARVSGIRALVLGINHWCWASAQRHSATCGCASHAQHATQHAVQQPSVRCSHAAHTPPLWAVLRKVLVSVHSSPRCHVARCHVIHAACMHACTSAQCQCVVANRPRVSGAGHGRGVQGAAVCGGRPMVCSWHACNGEHLLHEGEEGVVRGEECEAGGVRGSERLRRGRRGSRAVPHGNGSIAVVAAAVAEPQRCGLEHRDALKRDALKPHAASVPQPHDAALVAAGVLEAAAGQCDRGPRKRDTHGRHCGRPARTVPQMRKCAPCIRAAHGARTRTMHTCCTPDARTCTMHTRSTWCKNVHPAYALRVVQERAPCIRTVPQMRERARCIRAARGARTCILHTRCAWCENAHSA